MVKRILLAWLTLLVALPAFAQSFPKPPDVPAFSQVGPIYATTSAHNTTIDPAVTPAPYTGLTNIPIPSNTGRISTGTDLTPATFTGSISGTTLNVPGSVSGGTIRIGDHVFGTGVAANTTISSGSGTTWTVSISQTVGSEAMGSTAFNYCLTVANGGPSECDTAKFRTQANFTAILADDPIRNYGQPGTSHCHQFFGAGSPNAYSTYNSLRKHALNSAAAGTDANGTAYWFPCVEVLNPYSDGKNFAIRPDFVAIYYLGDPAVTPFATPLLPGDTYVFGWDMDASNYSAPYAWLQTYLDTANTAYGSTRYTIKNTAGRFFTQVQYECGGATAQAPYAIDSGHASYIVNPDGSDPWGGTCASGAQYVIDINGPDCWDGNNPWSPGGYKNIIPEVWDNLYSVWVCPTNYYRVPAVEYKLFYTQYGWTDVQRWVLSSDLAYRSAHSLTSTQIPSGFTFHGDWRHGWDQIIMLQWQQNCIGAQHNTPHQCDTSQINKTDHLLGGGTGETGAGGRNPQVSVTSIAHVNETDPGWIALPASFTGAMSGMKVHQ